MCPSPISNRGEGRRPMSDLSSLIDEWMENLLHDLDPVYAWEFLWDRLDICKVVSA
jgi:hypothetical protein